PTPENGGIGAIDRSRAGGYGRPVTVTDRGADMRFATNGRGDAIVLWTRDAPNQTTTWVSVRRAGEDWSPGLQVPTAQRFSQPLVELDDAGTATVVWTESDEPPEPCTPGPGYCPDDERVRAMTLSPAREWSAVQTLSAPDADDLRLSVAPDGGAVVTWSREAETAEGAIRSPDGTWSAAKRLVPGVWPVTKALPGGRVFLAWRAASNRRDALVAVREADGVLGPAHSVSPSGPNANGPRLSAAPDGRIALGWSSSKSGTAPSDSWGPYNPPPDTPASAEVAIGTPGEPFGAPAVLNPGETLGPAPSVFVILRTALGPGGFAVALLSRYDGDIDHRVVVRDVPLPAAPAPPEPRTTVAPLAELRTTVVPLADHRPPALMFRRVRRVRVTGDAIRVGVRCDERCVVRASGRIAARRRAFAVRAPATALVPGWRAELRLRVPAPARSGGRLSLRLQAVDAAGNRTHRRLRARLVRAK
ncbi:MAG: hypothetical protein M3P50_08705, partial [Actinomycetota bacterium]|nr:hypothetical protein [Actinomycetota bacterium]